MTLVSIVIVTWNSRQVLEDCISSLYAYVPSDAFELVLVDNGSEDGSYLDGYGGKSNVTIVRNGENLGFAKAVNIGLRKGTGHYSLILNPDMIFLSNPFPHLLEILRKDARIGVIAPLLQDSEGQPQIQDFYPAFPSLPQFVLLRSFLRNLPPCRALAMRFYHGRIGASGLHFVDQIPGAFLLFRRDLFGAEPALNEAYFIWMEDVDFCLRVHRKGLKVAVAADARITHIGGTSFKLWDVPKKRLMFTQSYLTYLEQYHSLAGFLAHAVLMILNAAGIALLYPVSDARKGWKVILVRVKTEIKVSRLILSRVSTRLGIGSGKSPKEIAP